MKRLLANFKEITNLAYSGKKRMFYYTIGGIRIQKSYEAIVSIFKHIPKEQQLLILSQ